MIGKYTCKVQVPDAVRDTKAEMALINYYGHLNEAVLVPAFRECTIDIPVKEFSSSMHNLNDTTKFLQKAIENVYGKGSMLFSYSFTPFNFAVEQD